MQAQAAKGLDSLFVADKFVGLVVSMLIRSEEGKIFEVDCPESSHSEVYAELQTPIPVQFSSRVVGLLCTCVQQTNMLQKLSNSQLLEVGEIAEVLDMQSMLNAAVETICHRIRNKEFDLPRDVSDDVYDKLCTHFKLLFV